MLDIKLENESLVKLRETLEVLTSYLPGVHNLYFEEEEVVIKEIDKTSVLGFFIKFDKPFFKKYSVEENIVSVDINDMNSILEKTDSKSQVAISLEENDDRLTFNIDEQGRNKIYRIPLMQNIEDSAEKAERGSVKKLKCSIELEEGAFTKVLKDLNIGDDIRKFIEIVVTKKGSPKKAQFNLYEKPDSAVSAEITITKDGGIIEMTKMKTDLTGQYDMDYLDKMKKLDSNGVCIMDFDEEDILRLTFNRENYQFIFFSAPIDIDEEEEEEEEEDTQDEEDEE